MIYVVAVLVVAGAVMPHRLRLEDAAPPVAATIWGAALALRALLVIVAALFTVLWLPATPLFAVVTHWCWHEVVPFLAVHLGLSGHRLGDAATTIPAALVALSFVSGLVGLWRAARAVSRHLCAQTVGPGPQESIVIGDADVMVAAAGLRRPRVVISAGALVAFDDDELELSLEHERGHIDRRHRFALIGAELCRRVAWCVPGTARAVEELVFHLERDADAFALGRRPDPAALATAICKSASAGPFGMAPAMALSGAGPTTRRVQQLLDGRAGRRTASAIHRAVAVAMVLLVTVTAAGVPVAIAAAPSGHGGSVHHCRS